MKNIVSSKIFLLGKEVSEIDSLFPWKLIADIPKFFESEGTSFAFEDKTKDVIINEENGPVIIDLSLIHI